MIILSAFICGNFSGEKHWLAAPSATARTEHESDDIQLAVAVITILNFFTAAEPDGVTTHAVYFITDSRCNVHVCDIVCHTAD